jgi:hypothetical protein
VWRSYKPSHNLIHIIIELVVQGVLVFITKKTVAEMLDLPKIGICKLLAKPTNEKEREKEATIYQQITTLETFVDWGGKVGKEGCLVKDFAMMIIIIFCLLNVNNF